MGKKLTKTYKELEKYSDNVMEEVARVLKENSIKHTITSTTELVIPMNGQSKDALLKTVYEGISIPKMIFILLMDVVEVEDKLYFRQQLK